LNYHTLTEYSFRLDVFGDTETKIEKIRKNMKNKFTVSHNMFSTMTEDERKVYQGRVQEKHHVGEKMI
jgi:C1A family cysteine protease